MEQHKNIHAVALGKLGGKAGKGKSKGFARDPEKARAAGKKGLDARWGKVK
jgi:general stress protein YciG